MSSKFSIVFLLLLVSFVWKASCQNSTCNTAWICLSDDQCGNGCICEARVGVVGGLCRSSSLPGPTAPQFQPPTPNPPSSPPNASDGNTTQAPATTNTTDPSTTAGPTSAVPTTSLPPPVTTQVPANFTFPPASTPQPVAPTSPPTPTGDSPDEEDNSSLVAVVIVLAVVLILIIGVCAFCFVRIHKKQQREAMAMPPPPTHRHRKGDRVDKSQVTIGSSSQDRASSPRREVSDSIMVNRTSPPQILSPADRNLSSNGLQLNEENLKLVDTVERRTWSPVNNEDDDINSGSKEMREINVSTAVGVSQNYTRVDSVAIELLPDVEQEQRSVGPSATVTTISSDAGLTSVNRTQPAAARATNSTDNIEEDGNPLNDGQEPDLSTDKRHQRRMEMVTSGNFVVLKMIGRGGFGVVSQCVLPDGTLIAMKEVDAVTPAAVSIGKNEAELLTLMNHRHIVRCYGSSYDEKNAKFRLFMELAAGGTLRQVVKNMPGPIDENIGKEFIRQLLEALRYLHQRKMVHRDVKSDNLMFCADGICKLVDFGTAKTVTTLSQGTKGRGIDFDTLAGTPPFMAPELFDVDEIDQSVGSYTEKSDIWSFGMTVIEILNRGALTWPAFANAWTAIIYVHSHDPPIPSHLSPEAVDFIKACLIRDPERRPTAAQLLRHPWLDADVTNGIVRVRKSSMYDVDLPSLFPEELEELHTHTKRVGLVRQRKFTVLHNLKNYVLGMNDEDVVSRLCLLHDGTLVVQRELLLHGDGNTVAAEAEKIQEEVDLASRWVTPTLLRHFACEYVETHAKIHVWVEWMATGTLQEFVINAQDRLPEKLVKRYIRQVCEALAFLHKKGIVHRDVRPINICMRQDGAAKLSDFSVCRNIGTTKVNQGALTIVGAPAYMAPEILDVAAGKDKDDEADSEPTPYNKRVDIWSLGVTVLVTLTRGALPWPAFSSDMALLQHIVTPDSQPIVPDFISDDCRDFIGKCLDRDPSTRPKASALLDHAWLKLDDDK